MKKNEVEGFFGRVSNNVYKRLRVCLSLGDSTLVRWLDDWQAVLQLGALLFFFAFALPMGITYFGFWYGGIYGYAWAFLWIGVSSVLAYREVIRRDKAIIGSEWHSNPKAIDEYIALVKKDP